MFLLYLKKNCKMSIFAQRKVNFISMPSLENVALIKLAITLWNHSDIRALVQKVNYDVALADDGSWQKIEDKVILKVKQLSQPESLKEKISCFIKPIGLELHHWIYYHHNSCDVGVIIPDKFHWSSQGTVDYKKTAEALINDKNLDIEKCYILACIYCLENYIPKLWHQMPECRRSHFLADYFPPMHLVDHWTADITGNVAKINEPLYDIDGTVFGYILGCTVLNYNKEASKYFFQKLNSEEEIKLLTEFIETVIDAYTHFLVSEYLGFLLSRLDTEQEMKIIEKCSFSFLACFLKWPFQSLFMETANRVGDYLKNYESWEILNRIVDIVISGYKDYDYRTLFGEFWVQMPKAHKLYVIKDAIYENDYSEMPHLKPALLAKLLKIGDLENFHLIIKEATAKECVIIFNAFGIENEDIFYSRPLIIQAFLTSQAIYLFPFVEEFRESILCRRSKEEIEKEKDMWGKLFLSLHHYLHKKNEEQERITGKKIGDIEKVDFSPFKRPYNGQFTMANGFSRWQKQ